MIEVWDLTNGNNKMFSTQDVFHSAIWLYGIGLHIVPFEFCTITGPTTTTRPTTTLISTTTSTTTSISNQGAVLVLGDPDSSLTHPSFIVDFNGKLFMLFPNVNFLCLRK